MENIKMKLTLAFKKQKWKKVQIELDSAIDNHQWQEARDILDQHRELFHQLLTENCDLKLKYLLHRGIIHGAPADIITQLISPHNINMQDEVGNTALHAAVRGKRWDLVPVLLQHGADVNMVNRWNQTPLHWAECRETPTDIITRLISPHNINMKVKVGGDTLLHEVMRGKRWDLVPVLLQHGADANLGNRFNKTPLHLAAFRGAQRDIITQLISLHNINVQDKKGNTALHEAVRLKRWELVPVLLQYGADPSILDSRQPDQPLVLSLKALCIATIRSHMPVKCDEAFEGLGLPPKLVSEVKLRPQAEDIVNISRESLPQSSK